jgi:hypothetical protein
MSRTDDVIDTLIAAVALLLLAALFTGCGSVFGVPQRGLWVDEGVPVTAALEACDVWAPVGVECVVATRRETAMVVISDSGEIGCEPDGNGVVWGGQGGRDWTPGTRTDGLQGGWVHMHMGCYPEADAEFVAALAHEFGHAMGVPHVPAAGALMNAAGGPARLTSDDIAAYWAAQP